MKPLLALFCCSVALCAADISSVQSVYVMPMARGLDQHLANHIASSGAFRVVTDPTLADAVLTDRIGESLRAALDEIAPRPKPPETAAEKPTGQSDAEAGAGQKLDNPSLRSSFGGSKGTVFLVDVHSLQVLWSTFEPPKSGAVRELDRTASDIVSRLKRDLKRK